MVETAVEALHGSGIPVAAVSTGFPAGLSPLRERIREIEASVAAGAQEIDIVITRAHLFTGNWQAMYDEVKSFREACGDAHMKTILATGDLRVLRNVARASLVCMMAGADFIKTSTGKLPSAATLPVLLCMLEAIRDVHDETGRVVGMKPAGGIRTAKQAIQNLVIVNETLGADWLTPDRFRLGASSLLNDVLMQIRTQKTGRYQNPEHFTRD
jgi:deoxyribose-phosphate aldolase